MRSIFTKRRKKKAVPAAKHKTKRTDSVKDGRNDQERLKHARELVYNAIGEIVQAKAAIYMARELNDLRHIEDVLWQLTTEERPRAMGGGS